MSDSNGSTPIQNEDEALQVLLDADIDKVMAGLDRIVEAAPSYAKLFSRWENQQWNSETFDFSEDRAQWEGDAFTDEQKAFIQWSMSSFFLGEERVTTELLPFAIAAPSHEARAFLATQISDEAKHMVFFDRFYREVYGVTAETLSENVNSQRSQMNDEYRELFDGILHECADTLRRDPSDMDALVRGVTVYMVVIEGTLALTGARFMIRSLKEMDLLPGFRQGFTAVNRDESRHVGFGVKFLADAIKEDERHKQTIQDTLSRDAAGGHAGARAADGGRPLRLRDAVRLHVAGDLRVRDEVAVEEARGDGHGAHRRRPRERHRARAEGPGRPSSGARERVLEAGLEVLKADGYAGLTTAKVAARSGQNKALISYHFGSKQGLVAAVGHELSESITEELLGGIEDRRHVEGIIRGAVEGLRRLMDRDERLARLYFDLTAVSVVEPDVRRVMSEMKAGWRTLLASVLGEAEDGPAPKQAESGAVFVIAGLDGLALERLSTGETPALKAAQAMFVKAAAAALSR